MRVQRYSRESKWGCNEQIRTIMRVCRVSDAVLGAPATNAGVNVTPQLPNDPPQAEISKATALHRLKLPCAYFHSKRPSSLNKLRFCTLAFDITLCSRVMLLLRLFQLSNTISLPPCPLSSSQNPSFGSLSTGISFQSETQIYPTP